ncbi:RS10B protein, partial [Prunella fulvescens]|nr:RS10B protein [Prunella fulvescens]
LADEAKEDQDEQKELLFWMCQVETFLTTKLFPAFEHETVLRKKIIEQKKQEAELAKLRVIQAAELDRLIAEKEVEEAERREATALQGSVKPRKRALSFWERLLYWRGLQLKKEAHKRKPSAKERGSQSSRA